MSGHQVIGQMIGYLQQNAKVPDQIISEKIGINPALLPDVAGGKIRLSVDSLKNLATLYSAHHKARYGKQARRHS